MKEINARDLFASLRDDVLEKSGKIVFSLHGTSVTINTNDIVGNSLQSWLKKWMDDNEILNSEPSNTQAFPDFYLSKENENDNMLEVKAFNYQAAPAFDIANYESYVESVSEKPYILFADYLIFGYSMDETGIITIKDIWLKKIWEITGKSKRFALNTQVKRDVIYNIRPSSNFKYNKDPVFSTKEEFLKAIYDTQAKYRGASSADLWKEKIMASYNRYYGEELMF